MYKKKLKEGFGKSRGEFTVQSQQACVPRLLVGKIDSLKRLTKMQSAKFIKKEVCKSIS